MSKETAKFESICPSCGEKVSVVANQENIINNKVSVKQSCQRCLNSFEAISELDCLKWDDQCQSEIGRLG